MSDSTVERMTVSEYSELIGKSKQSIYNRIKRGTIKSETVDGVTFVYVSTIDKPLNQSFKQPFKGKEKSVRQIEDHTKLINIKSQLKEYKELYRECRDAVKEKDKEIKRLNKKLNAEKDVSIDILKQFIGEMKALTHKNEPLYAEIVEDEPKKKKKKKKKK